MDGKSVAPGFPNLAGQDFQYLKNQLMNYRNKTRTGGQSTLMYGMAGGLSDDIFVILSASPYYRLAIATL